MTKNIWPGSKEIKTSFNYDSFKLIDWNREINKQNLGKLISLNKKRFQMHLFPILVSKEFEIIDGQHRFTACKEIGCPVYYIVDGNECSFDRVHSVNIAGKRHSLKDKLEMLYKSGSPGASAVYKIHSDFDELFDISAIATLLINFGSTGSAVNDSIDNNGDVLLNYYDKTYSILSALNRSAIPERHTVRACYALARLSNINKSITPKEIIKRVDLNVIKWVNPKSVDETIRSIINCYNYGLKSENRINKGK